MYFLIPVPLLLSRILYIPTSAIPFTVPSSPCFGLPLDSTSPPCVILACCPSAQRLLRRIPLFCLSSVFDVAGYASRHAFRWLQCCLGPPLALSPLLDLGSMFLVGSHVSK